MKILRTSAAILAVSALPFLAGCSLVGAGAPSMAESESAEQEESGPATARVANDSWYNISVYVVDSGRRQRLGSVPSYESSSFEIPEDMVSSSGQIQMLADPVGSTTTYRSSPVLVGPGQMVKWTVQNNPSQTYASITVM
ncbi:MAG: hypothetical protein Q8W44_01955 [Candidatus Palauibacterales bacterium]|nr:hypothetical protein [Candidatus Palauibacterales bacterium]